MPCRNSQSRCRIQAERGREQMWQDGSPHVCRGGGGGAGSGGLALKNAGVRAWGDAAIIMAWALSAASVPAQLAAKMESWATIPACCQSGRTDWTALARLMIW